MANFGETLKQARAHKGVTLKEAEQATRINRSHLAALEDENFRALPPLIYQRGIVRNYALYLGLDPAQLLSLSDEARGDDAETQPRGIQAVPPVDMPTHWAPNFAIISFSVVLSAIVFAWVYSAILQSPPEEAEPTEIVTTVTPLAGDVALPTSPPATPTPAPSPTPEPTATAVGDERVATGRDLPTPAPSGSSEGSGPPTSAPADTSEGSNAPAPTPVESEDDGGGSDNQLQQQQASQNQQTDQTAADIQEVIQQSLAPAEEPASDATSGGANVTSIKVEALDDITVSVVADGVEVFSGALAAGQETGFYDASVFEVYTSSGASTLFTNACGVDFQMGYQPGETVYSLTADEESCAPIGN